VDIRGTGASEGVNVDEYVLQEQLDGYDAIEWIAQQPWCDGHVNMMGISYGGFTSLQVASHAPPHLTSIIPVDFTDDRYTDDCHYRGGLLRKYFDVGYYGNFMIAYNALPPYPDWSGGDWASLWEEHLARNEPYFLKWLHHQTDGPYWRHGSVRDVADRIRCPVFMIGGWRDGYPNPPLRLYQALGVPRKVLIGPWNHAFPDAAIPGPRIDYLHEVVRWLDHWCKGTDTGILEEPPVVVFVQRSEPPVVDRLDSAGEWRAETGWPPPGASERTFYLAPGGALADTAGAEGEDVFEYVPAVGVAGGLWSGGIQFGLPGDQRVDEAFSLVYTSEPLERELTIMGRPRVLLHVATTAPVLGFATSLSDVAPDGSSHLVAKGMLNATRRASLTEPTPIVPGETMELEIEVDATAWTFARGNRIRLAVANADWPNVWPTPFPATSTVYRGGERASDLVLPVVPARGSARPPRFRPSLLRQARHSDGVSPPTWEVTLDVLTGRSRVRIEDVREERINETTVVRRENALVAEVDAANPAGASAHGRHVSRIARPTQVTEGRSDVFVQASPTHFHVTIDLELEVNGSRHFAKHWVESIERELL
jgi:predicted acyl esterase